MEASSSGGIWAPTIRYQDGVFYITATFSEKGNFILTSKDIEKGFSDPIWVEMDGIDPSLFFENGKVYYCANDIGSRMKKYGTEGISVARINATIGKLLEEPVRIWEGTGGGFLESPHIYHVGDFYYLMVSEGGTSLNHMITIARSKSIYGPFESCPNNPILTNRNDTSKAVLCTGHGDLVDDVYGNWWMVHLGTRPSTSSFSHLGRETFLMPVKWEKEWPIVGNDAKCHLEEEGPLPAGDNSSLGTKENETEWLTLRSANKEKIRIAPNEIEICASKVPLSEDMAAPAMLLTRQKDFHDTLCGQMHFEPLQNGDFAGVVVYVSHQYFYRMGIKREKERKYLVVEKVAEDFYQIAFQKEILDTDVALGIRAEKEKYHFLILEDGVWLELCSASTRFLCCEFAGRCFTGVLWGMFAESTEDSGATARFNLGL